MKKTKGAKLLNKIKKIKKKILKKYKFGTLVKYITDGKIYKVHEHDRQNVEYVSVFMGKEYFWVSVKKLEIIKSENDNPTR